MQILAGSVTSLAVTPIYKQWLDAIDISIVLLCVEACYISIWQS